MTEQRADRDPWAAAIEEAFRTARAGGLSISAAADVVAAVIRETLAEQAAAEVTNPDNVVSLQSILSARTGDPLVQVRCGPAQWQWDTTTTRQHALRLLEAAEAAEHDAMVFRWLTLGPPDIPEQPAIQALADLRRFRGDVDREDWRPAEQDRTS